MAAAVLDSEIVEVLGMQNLITRGSRVFRFAKHDSSSQVQIVVGQQLQAVHPRRPNNTYFNDGSMDMNSESIVTDTQLLANTSTTLSFATTINVTANSPIIIPPDKSVAYNNGATSSQAITVTTTKIMRTSIFMLTSKLIIPTVNGTSTPVAHGTIKSMRRTLSDTSVTTVFLTSGNASIGM